MDKIRISFDVEGDVARAFLKEFAARVEKGEDANKAVIGRAALVEYLNKRGHKVEVDDEEQRGGYRGQRDTTPGQPAAVSVR